MTLPIGVARMTDPSRVSTTQDMLLEPAYVTYVLVQDLYHRRALSRRAENRHGVVRWAGEVSGRACPRTHQEKNVVHGRDVYWLLSTFCTAGRSHV